jgi:beta-phosphoglucomutase
MEPDEIFPGVKALLQRIRNAGIRIGLASSSKNAPRVVSALGIEAEFDTIVDGSMVTHAKPDPEIFLLAAERLGVAPGRCVVFEDAAAGVTAALAAGMKCVGVGAEDQLGHADAVIRETGQFDFATLNDM